MEDQNLIILQLKSQRRKRIEELYIGIIIIILHQMRMNG